MARTTKLATGTDLARQVWARYEYLRDNGHTEYVEKAEKCEDFFAGLQWTAADLTALKKARRPAITINKILATMSNVMGAQIFNRTDTAFKPRNSGATDEVADALTKVFMQIGDNNQLVWVRSDVFADGIIGSRGFFDVRLDFKDSLIGEVRIKALNPKNTLIDSDADTYDPEGWADWMYTEWLSLNDIELLYGKDIADRLYNSATSGATDSSIEMLNRDRFGGSEKGVRAESQDYSDRLAKNIRVLDYQYKCLDLVEHFVHVQTGDIRPVPHSWTPERKQEYMNHNPEVTILKRWARRIRWVVVAGDEILHDAWSPYKRFTIAPYFPHFRRGRTIGLVENLLGPQELLNKVSSQELHVVNTTANSGWKIKRNSLQNMSLSELEEKGSMTGLVMELDDLGSAEKITPNATPSGLDRISYKSEDHIKSISGVSDYMSGFAREDVSAKSVKANQAGGAANLAKIQDNLNRTDTILAYIILDIVQDYYTEPRLLYITTNALQNRGETIEINKETPEGEIINDMTLGEYSVVVTNQPDRDTFEESQFDQIELLRTNMGIKIPDRFAIQSSRLRDKADILQAMEGDADSPEAKRQAALKARMEEAEVSEVEATAQLKKAQATKAMADAQASGNVAAKEPLSAQDALALRKQTFEEDMAAKELQLKQYEIDKKFELDQYELRLKYGAEQRKQTLEESKYHTEKQAAESEKKVAATQVALKQMEEDDASPVPANEEFSTPPTTEV